MKTKKKRISRRYRFSALFLAGVILLTVMPFGSFSSYAADPVTVTVSILGDTVHPDDTSVSHTLSAGNLTAWAEEAAYELEEGSTVLDAIYLAAELNGVTVNAYSYEYDGVTYWYIDSAEKDGVTLAAFTNTELDGWMFCVNNSYYANLTDPVSDGDVILLYYTDDYTAEDMGYGDYEEYEEYDDGLETDFSAYQGAADAAESIYQAVGQALAASLSDAAYGDEWVVIGLARAGVSGLSEVFSAYADSVAAVLQENDGILSTTRSTEYSRVILALTAINHSVTDVGGVNLLAALSDYDAVVKQGLTGAIYALLALDAGNYEIPAAEEGKTQTTRELLVNYILNEQKGSGVWTYSGDDGDADLIAMALAALAPYTGRADVEKAVNDGVTVLSALQSEDGFYENSFGEADCETCAQVIVALAALGINPAADERFVKNGVSVLDALCAFYVEGGFAHTLGGEKNALATEQGYYALAAYFRFLNGETSLYDMSDLAPRTGDTGGDGTMLPFVCVGAVLVMAGTLLTAKKESREKICQGW